MFLNLITYQTCCWENLKHLKSVLLDNYNDISSSALKKFLNPFFLHSFHASHGKGRLPLFLVLLELQVHMCNKLASRHVRVGLADPSDVPRCDICESGPGM